MAKMIPSDLSPDIKSSAERRVFEWFRDSHNTEDWVVLHSMGIANHNTVIYGEIDFLVLAPKYGIFVLEVKGGRVRRQDGVWIFTDKYNNENKKIRGPIEQAKEGMFSLLEDINKKFGKGNKFSNFFHGFGVVFPDIEFEIDDPSINRWQIFDKSAGKDVVTFIKILGNRYKDKWTELYGHYDNSKIPNHKDIREYAQVLRGDFDKFISISTQLEISESGLISLTNEQYNILDALSENSRLLVQGAAGTGKTLLVIEEAKKSVKEGKKVGLFCFNNSLGSWLQRYFEATDEHEKPFYVGTFHSFMLKISRDNDIRFQFQDSNEFYRYELPVLAVEALSSTGALFDKIVIDEAQDLINPEYLELFDLLLIKGLKHGKWSMYGDFNMQAIFSEFSFSQMKEMIDAYAGSVNYKLTINCRNTKPIAEEVKNITGVEATEKLLSKIDGLPVNYYTYNKSKEQIERLKSVIKRLLDEKVKPNQITILTTKKREDSIINEMEDFIIKDYDPNQKDHITFSTVQSYKGLENSVIILTDVENYDSEKLLYIGLSRARTMLIVLESVNANKQRNKKLYERYL